MSNDLTVIWEMAIGSALQSYGPICHRTYAVFITCEYSTLPLVMSQMAVETFAMSSHKKKNNKKRHRAYCQANWYVALDQLRYCMYSTFSSFHINQMQTFWYAHYFRIFRGLRLQLG